MNGLTSAVKAVVVLALAALVGAAPAAAAPRKADLAVGAVSGVPASVAPGGSFSLTYKVKNQGRKRAPASRLALWLSADARRDKGDVAVGGGKVKAVAARARRAGHATVTVPARAGAFVVIACADGAGKVREASERNNCRVAGRVTVAAPAPAPAPSPAGDPGPAGEPTPSPSPSPEPTPEPSPDPAPVHTPPAAPAPVAMRAVAITDSAPQRVVEFSVDAPGTLLRDVAVSGLQAGESLNGIDVRPSTGRVVATSDAGRVLVLDPATGGLTPMLPAAFGIGPFGQDFDPVEDRLHSVDSTARHVSYDPGGGVTTERQRLAYLAGDAHDGDAPAISGLAYTDDYASTYGARMLGIDTAADALVEVTDEPLGLVETIGATGVDATAVAGFDIAGAGTAERAYAVLAKPGASRSSLYRLNLDTGAATRVGDVGSAGRYGGLALLPPERGGIQASSDAWPDTDLDDEALMIGIDRGTVCPPDGAYHQLGLAAALDSADAFIRRKAGQDALDAFAASPEYDDALQSVRAAAAAISAGQPGAALATLLRAHQLKPGDPTILLNAGGVAASVGLGSEALAMIRAAEVMPAPASSPMGLDWTGRLQIAYAHAYTSLSQWDNVEKAAKAAREHEPNLGAEAANQLAAVKLCRDDDTSAAASYRARARVRNEKPTPIDETRGRVMHLRNIPLPALPKNAAGAVDFYWGFVQRLGGESVANAQRNQVLFGKLDKAAEPAVKRRRDGLLARSAKVTDRADARALLAESSKDIDDAMAIHQRLFGPQGRYIAFLGEASDACEGSDDDVCFTNEMRSRCVPETRLSHSGWLDEVTDAMHAEQRYIELISRRMSGIGANFADQDHVDYIRNQIEGQEITAANRIVQEVHFWSVSMRNFADYCVEEPEPSTFTEPEAPQAEAERCTKSAKAYQVKAELTAGTTAAGESYKVAIKANCDEAKLEGSITMIPFIQAFGSLGYAAKSGETTVVIGGKAKLDGKVVTADFQSGVYVKFDHAGEFHDIGWRFGPTVTGTSSMVEYQTKDTQDLSFIEGIRYMREGFPD